MCLAVPGEVLSIAGDDPLVRSGRVDFGGIIKEVSLALVPDCQPGDHVLVHVGVALSVVDEEEADRIRDLLRQMGELADAEDPG